MPDSPTNRSSNLLPLNCPHGRYHANGGSSIRFRRISAESYLVPSGKSGIWLGPPNLRSAAVSAAARPKQKQRRSSTKTIPKQPSLTILKASIRSRLPPPGQPALSPRITAQRQVALHYD